MAHSILRLPEVIERTGLSRSSIYQRISNGTFPDQVVLGAGARAVGWRESDIDEWIASLTDRGARGRARGKAA